ncbi:MAG: hypothetical protein KDC98_03110, partial [Planctomycetes bacterium]|nr:hypothetical protein [Planctomycetota bacterium]
MNLQTTAAILAATLFGISATAQGNCPKERAETVPRQIVSGGTQDCGGISINIGGVQIHEASKGCPLFIIYEPEHSVAVPAKLETMVELLQMLDVTEMRYECDSDWFLFIPYNTACTHVSTQTVSFLPLLRTVPCPL